MNIDPQICGRWDGCHLWVQWDNAGADAVYRLQYRLRPTAAEAWGEWLGVGGDLSRPWLKFPIWREGWQVQTRVALAESEAWSIAREVTFTRSRCVFEITAARPVHYPAGSDFSAIIDGAACCYRLLEEVEVAAGESVQVGMEADAATGWSQLDHPDHFRINPHFGLVIRNLAPSTEDTQPTGRDFTELVPLPREGPVRIAFQRQ